MSRALAIAVALVTVAAVTDLGRVERDDRPAFRIDPTRDFRLEFGRGSGWAGLDTVRVGRDGKVAIHRRNRQQEDSWEAATLQLSPDSLAEVLKAVEANGLMNLHRAYSNPYVHDGTQWVLWIEQGGREKTVYFNNRFPGPITRFAKQLDDILSVAGLGGATWVSVPVPDSREHERELWASIRR